MKRKSFLMLVSGLTVALGLSVAVPADAATIGSVGPGTLVVKGVQVSVPMTFTCEGDGAYPSYVYLNVLLSQKNGNNVNRGSGADQVDCTFRQQTVTFTVSSDSLSLFKKGPAAYTVITQECSVGGCLTRTESGTLAITK